MANFPILQITFDTGGAVPISTVLSFESDLTGVISETARNYSSVGNFDRGFSALDSANGYRAALVRDYGFKHLIGGTGIVVTIEGSTHEEVFSNFSFPGLTVDYTPGVAPAPEFEITNITVQAADIEDRNTHCRYNLLVENGTTPYDITSPISKLAQIEPLFYDYLRQPPIPLQDFSVTDDNLDVATRQPFTVDYFTLDSITVNESGSGATVIANTTTLLGDIGTSKEYSLDQILWQSGSSYTGVLPGSYTMYMRDNLGADYSLPFTVVGVAPDKPEPYHEIVNTNPIRHIERISYGCDFIPNWDNALFADILEYSFTNVEERGYNQLIHDCDTSPTQIRTNYDNITINVLDCDNNIVLSPTAVLKKENILQEDKRDCTLKQVNSGVNVGKTFLYFTGGNIYEPNTLIVESSYNNASKKVFPFAVSGSLFSISDTATLNGDYTQLGVVFDVESGYWGIVLDVSFSGDAVQPAINQTVYNEQVYNIWEYSLVGAALSAGIYRIEIDLQDDDVRYDDVKYDTEPICKIIDTFGTVVFDGSNSQENTANIDFTTGINLRLRVGGRFIVSTNQEETIDFKAQSGKKVIQKTTITRSIPFESDLVPFYISEKIAILSSLDTLKVQNVDFVKGEDAETESKASEQNPFVLIVRDYQQDDQITITDNVGLVTESSQVIGSTTAAVIGV